MSQEAQQEEQDPLDSNSQFAQQLSAATFSPAMLTNNNTGNPLGAPAPLFGGNATSSSMSAMLGGLAPNAIVGLLPAAQPTSNEADQQQQSQAQQVQPQQPDQVQPQQQALDLTSELKRLQQIHQMSTAPNALLMTGQQQTQQASQQAALMQSLFGAAATAGVTSGLDTSGLNAAVAAAPASTTTTTAGSTVGTAPLTVNPTIFAQPGLLQDARLLSMAQTQFGAPLLTQAATAPAVATAGVASASGLVGEHMPLPSPHSLFHRDGTRRMRGGVIEPFPEKLHRLLTECELANRSDVISWVANGRAFAIHKPDKFFKEIVPLYFRQSRLSSFKRQLNLYGFELINSGPSRGGYFHELFIKDHPEACRRMRRVAVKVSGAMKNNAAAAGKTEDSKESAVVRTDNVASSGVDSKAESPSAALADNVSAFLPGAGTANVADLLALQHQVQQSHQEPQQPGGNTNNLGGL